MSTIKLTRTQRRRRLRKLADEVHRLAEADHRFFERHSHRQHRVRLAAQAEIEQAEILAGEPMTAPPGCRLFTVVRNIKPGVCARLLVLNREGAETDLPEATTREIWEVAATPWDWEALKAAVRKAAAFDDEAA